ncbi:pickpocket protein 28-like [Rhynchophorus ferrugineus]|uniref:pickpocket protein 28-like n=1 Tax=Rhynchophorus ferrugineus TaxID=354439 RepID=UPI003FCE1F71
MTKAVVSPPKNQPVFCKSFRNYFREYCQCTGVHGFRYFGEKRTRFERIWWFIVFCFVFTACAYLIKEVYHKWERSPVIVSFATSETPIYKIPFPAVTICPESKSKHSVYNHTDIIVKLSRKQKLNRTEETKALYMSLICDLNQLRKLNKAGVNTFSDDFLNFINSARRERYIFECSWMGDNVNCDSLFVPVITDEGICYTFNMLDRSDMFREDVIYYENFLRNPERENLSWTLDDGYGEEEGLKTYPRRASLAGVKNSLQVSLIAWNEDIDYTCKGSLEGFRVMLHTPMRIPTPSQQYFKVPLDEVVLGSIQPVMITTSDTVKVYNPKRRECYFPAERTLRYFKIYTQLNCQLECLTNFTLSLCNCVNFYMPRTGNTKICGAAKKNCMMLAEKWLQTKGLVKKLNELRTKPKNNTDDDDLSVPFCDCMPICTDLTYDVETSQAGWKWQGKWKALHPDQQFKENQIHKSQLTLYFKTSQFVTSKRHELYGPTDFLANFGGLLGLFTGFSVLSLMEIIYFLTVRVCCNIRMYGMWYGPET